MPAIRSPKSQSLVTRDDLDKLKRIELQALAKRETLKAYGTKADIIDQLFEKYPEGVPETVLHPAARRTTPRNRQRRAPRSHTTEPEIIQVSMAVKDDPEGISDKIDLTPVQPVRPLTRSQTRRKESTKYTPDPTSLKNVRSMARVLAVHADNRAPLISLINETQALLDHLEDSLSNAENNVSELVGYRESLEEEMLPIWKGEVFLWNGIGLIEGAQGEEERRVWKDWYKAARRALNPT